MVDSWSKRIDGTTVWSDRQGNTSTTTVTWTTATRPTSPYDGQTGRNTDFNGLEEYVTSLSKWRTLSGSWTTATRPTGVAVGSRGFNTDEGIGNESWNGTEWVNG